MASKDYLVLELTSPSKRETIQALSVSINSQDGDHQILPLHEPWTGTHKPQAITFIINDSNQTTKTLYISSAISKVIQDIGERTKFVIACQHYSYNLDNNLEALNRNSNEQLSRAKLLATTELLPRLTKTAQESRDIEAEIRHEFEDSLK
jgi:hypothetical protein